MSRSERRREREAEYAREHEAEYEEREREQARKDVLCMYDRIAEAEASEGVKDILHRIAEHVGLE